jgi:ABC-type uncharacterized transport system ATPase subunit
MSRQTEAELVLDDVHVSFGGLRVLNGVSMRFGDASLNCIIGPNGAGKTTVFNVLSGVVSPDSGALRLDGRDISKLSPMRIARMGIVRKLQVPTVFLGLSVGDNLRVAEMAPRHLDRSGSQAFTGRTIVELLGLKGREKVPAEELSHGERQWLEIGMAFLGRPRFLLLDEPAAGLGPAESRHTADLILQMAESCCVVVIEHDMHFVRALGGDVTVLHQGSVLRRGAMAEIEADETVRDVYLGRGSSARGT